MYFKKLALFETLRTLQSGELDLLLFINRLCDRIDKVDPIVKSLLSEKDRRQRLLTDAKSLLTLYPDPSTRPPLFGLPVGIKDIYRVDGFETACGSNLPPSLFEGKEATVVSALKKTGALILGKTHTTEFAYFQPGPTKNPCNIEFTPGGSSSGSAASVAAGLTPLSFGTQTIGSITRPAAFCGVIGIKPSFNSISTDGIIPFSKTLDHVGYFTHDLGGAEYVSSLFCEEWNTSEKNTIEAPKIGIPSNQYINQANSTILQHFNSNIEELNKAKITIVRTRLFDEIEEINTYHKQIAAKEFANTHLTWFTKHSALYSKHASDLIKEGLKVSDTRYKTLLDYKRNLQFDTEILMKSLEIDAWISPSTLGLPLKGLSSTGSPLMNLPWTFLGLPTITIPIAITNNSLPIGLQFSGRFGGLKILFSILKKLPLFSSIKTN